MRVPAVRTGKRAVISVRRGARPRLRVLRSAATAAVVLCGLVACATTSGGGSPYGTGDPTLAERTWVLLTESPEGGWGINGRANTGSDIAQAARSELAALAEKGTGSS